MPPRRIEHRFEPMSTNKLTRAAFIALLAITAALPAAAQKSRSRDTTELRLARVADSAALLQALRELPAAPAGPLPAYIIHYDSTGARSAVEAVFKGSAEVDSAVVGVLRRLSAERLTPAHRGWLMLQVATGADAGVGAYPGRGREDQPRVMNAPAVGRGLDRLFSRYPDVLQGRGLRMFLQILVDFDGTVAEARLVTNTGIPGLNRDLVELARGFRFRPGRIDGRPVRTWVTLPLFVRQAPDPPAPPLGGLQP